jgi:hypothetical protein
VEGDIMHKTERKYIEMFIEKHPTYDGRPEDHSVKNGVRYLINHNKAEFFSFTKIFPVIYDAGRFLGVLRNMKKLNETDVLSWSCIHLKGAAPSTTFPLLLMLASESQGAVADASANLVNMVQECPKGKIAELVFDAFKRHWGDEPKYNEWMKQVEGTLEKKEDKNIIRIGYGPTFMDKKQIQEISDLFLFPTWPEIGARSWIDD